MSKARSRDKSISSSPRPNLSFTMLKASEAVAASVALDRIRGFSICLSVTLQLQRRSASVFEDVCRPLPTFASIVQGSFS